MAMDIGLVLYNYGCYVSMYRLFRLTDKKKQKGKIEFVGSILFTHCDEIKDPLGLPSTPLTSVGTTSVVV